jgi:glycosyltransferase involved in cell wall biosynthesis
MDHLKRTFPSFNDKFVLNRLGIEDKNLGHSSKSLMREPMSGSYLIVTCSNLTPRKRLRLVPEILKFVKNKVKWVHIGGGDIDEISELKKICMEHEVACEFLGQLTSPEIVNYYRHQNIALFCNLSYAEGIPVSLMEAAMFGIPMMATNTFGNPEIVNQENGILIPIQFESKNVASQIDILLNDEVNWSIKSMSSRKIYLQRFQASLNMRDFLIDVKNRVL